MPMARMGHPRAEMRGKEKAMAARRAAAPAVIMARGETSPVAVARRGPRRREVSAPFPASTASLK